MTTTVEIVKDSISKEGIRLTTFKLRYPRFIHAELMTHRVFSRNASSSRAIPVHRMIEELRRDPAMPVYWGSNKPGMQAGEELTGEDLNRVQQEWLDGMRDAIKRAQRMIDTGLHKQIANRVLEPWAHINVIVTATSYKNFFKLRCHPDAQPEIAELAGAMQLAYDNHKPTLLQTGEWHLPFIEDTDWTEFRAYAKIGRITRDEPQYPELVKLAIPVSIARCASVSYLTHEGKQTTIEEDTKLHDRLVVAEPLHASPAEHQATPDVQWNIAGQIGWEHPELHGNLEGFCQYRKTLPGEFTPG